MWDFETEPDFQVKLDWMRQFIDDNLVPLEPIQSELPAGEWKAVKQHLQQQVKDQGLWGAFLDPKLGGPGFGQLKLALMSEIIGRCMISMTIFGVQAPDSGNMELLAHGANEDQKRRWLEPNMRGEISSAFALTEPFNAGADPTKISTTAVRDGDEWVINGHKWFITNASIADIVLVFAETDPDRDHTGTRACSSWRPARRGWRSSAISRRCPILTCISGSRAATPRSCSVTAGCPTII